MTANEPKTRGDDWAALVIGFYLVVHVVLLAYVGAVAWLANSMTQLHSVVPLIPEFEPVGKIDKLSILQKGVVAACTAGLGGAVFMIRELYINYAYGGKGKGGEKEFLKRKEIPRYVLLPFSSVVLGPIIVCLAQTGAIIFAGFSTKAQIPYFTIVALSFVIGFCYHDTLKFLRTLSRNIFDRSSEVLLSADAIEILKDSDTLQQVLEKLRDKTDDDALKTQLQELINKRTS